MDVCAFLTLHTLLLALPGFLDQFHEGRGSCRRQQSVCVGTFWFLGSFGKETKRRLTIILVGQA